MAKQKIQVSTIQMQCNAEVVVLNSYTVLKAAKAIVGVEQFKNISDALGNPRFGEMVDDNGEPVTHFMVHKDQMEILADYVFPFVEELAKAIEDQEESKHN